MPEALQVYTALQLAALAALPLALRLGRTFPDRGWALAKPLGVFALATADRWLFASGLVELTPRARTLLVLAFGLGLAALLCSGVGGRRRRAELTVLLARRRPRLLAIEALFALAFALGLLLRAASPALEATEQPTDLMLLAAELDAPAWPIEDPWLAGAPVGYYTLGHAAAAVLARIAGLPAPLAYNVTFALWIALAAVACSGLAGALLPRTARGRRFVWLGALPLFCANPVAISDALRQLAGRAAASPAGAWWWRSSRLLVDEQAVAGSPEVISEFPLFAVVVGDLHAHFLALPLALLAAALGVALARAPRLRACHFGAVAGVTGASAAANSWDLPLVLLLLCGGAALGASGSTGGRRPFDGALRRCGTTLVAACAGGALVALPHLLVAETPVTALVVNSRTASSPLELATLFAVVLPGLTLLGLRAARVIGPPAWRGVAAVAALAAALAVLAPAALHGLAGAPGQGGLERPDAELGPGLLDALAARGPGGALAGATAWAAAGGFGVAALALRRRGEARLAAAAGLAAVGVVLIGGAELFYLRDGLATRLNTVFKLHFGAWPPLALAALAGGLPSATDPRAPAPGVTAARVASAAALLALASGALYGLARAGELARAPGYRGLDALAALALAAPDEAAALRWISDQVPRTATVLQAPGESYRPEQSRVATFTGRATLLGWRGHEVQWRGRRYAALAAGREQAAEEIYRASDAERRRRALERYDIELIWVGPVERARYELSEAEESGLAEVAELVFQRGEISIWRRLGS